MTTSTEDPSRIDQAASTTLGPTIQPTASDRSDTNPRTAAIIAGIGYVLLFVFAVFANFLV